MQYKMASFRITGNYPFIFQLQEYRIEKLSDIRAPIKRYAQFQGVRPFQ